MKPSYLFSPSVKREKHHYWVKTNNKAENGNHEIKKLPVMYSGMFLPKIPTPFSLPGEAVAFWKMVFGLCSRGE